MAARHVVEFGRREQRELDVRQRFLEAAHQGQPIVERELLRIVTADDVDLVEVRAGLEGLGEDFVGGHPHDPLALFELVGGERTELAAA
jgi:hypothetical protein